MTAAETLFRILAAPPSDEGDDHGDWNAFRGDELRDSPGIVPEHPDYVDVDAIRRGDHRAFERVFLAHHAALCEFGQRLRLTKEDAADVVEEVFLRIWRGRTHFQVHTSIAAYLYTAVRHRTFNLQRGQRRELQRMTALQPELEAASVTESIDVVDSGASAHAERATVLREAMANLSERRRLALTLRWEAGLNNTEIAAVLGIAPQSVANLMQRALADLRAMLPDLLE